MSQLTRMPRTQLLILISIVIVIASLFANIVDVGNNDTGDAGSVGGWIGLSVFGIAVSALLLLVAVPRLNGDQRRLGVLGFGIAAVVTIVAFWSMLPFALGAAALSAAGPSDDSAEGEEPAPSTAGVILALLGIVGAFVMCIIG